MPQEFQTIGLIGRKKIGQHKAFLLKVKDYLEKKGCHLLWDDHLEEFYGKEHMHGHSYILKHANMVITLGGDGTVLKLVRDLPKRKDLAIFGVNLGTVGFFTEVKKSDRVFEILDEFFEGKYHMDERLVLRVTQYRNREKLSTHLALNEAVINQGNFARLISMSATIDQRQMIKFKADGVIIASPTGSTGHSLSAGGPILHPRIDGIVFSPICPSELSVRPIVIPSHRQLTVTVETDRKFKDNKIGLTIDGQIVLPLEYGDQVKIRKSSRKLRFIRKQGGGQRYYRLLRDKLSWGKKA